MSPEIALIVRAVLLVLAVVAVERFVVRRRSRLAEQRRTLVRLPMVLNPVSQPLRGRPLEVSALVSGQKPVASTPSNVVRLEPAPTYLDENAPPSV